MTGHVASCAQCGWRSTHVAASAARAAAQERRHRCKPIVVRDCGHDGRHQHGTVNAYNADGCRCAPCRRAAADYAARRYKAKAAGKSLSVGVEPVREHIQALRARGLMDRRIAELAGVSQPAIRALRSGQAATTHRTTADAILAVPLTSSPAATSPIEATGSRRRIQALVVLGWSYGEIGRRIGISPNNVRRIAVGSRGTTEQVRSAIADCYDQLWNKTPAGDTEHQRSVRARVKNRAARLGWHSPLAWDDDSIEDPDARPVVDIIAAGSPCQDVDEVAVTERMAGNHVHITRAERQEAVRRLHAHGLDDHAIGRRIGISGRQVLRDRKALGLPAVTSTRRENPEQQARRAG